MAGVLLVAGWRHPFAADFASRAARAGRRRVAVIADPATRGSLSGGVDAYPPERLAGAGGLAGCVGDPVEALVVFLNPQGGDASRHLIEVLAAAAAAERVGRVCLVSTFRVHFGDRRAEEAEALAVRCFEGVCDRLVVLRPGHLVSEDTSPGRLGRWLGAIPPRFRSCVLDPGRLSAVIEDVLTRPGGPRVRTYTVLGPNRPWNEARGRGAGLPVRLAGVLFGCFPVGQLLAAAFALLSRRWPRLRAWNFDTLRPTSVRELLALHNPYNYRDIKIVGYNNGVTHFGQRYPGRTVVSTVRCCRHARLRGDVAKIDAGSTVRAAAESLRAAGKEFHVVPNYTYVSVGTAYFVPIHGSASRFSTVAETIDKVVLYDPAGDRVVAAGRGDPEFGRYMYDAGADVLLLRLYVRVKDRSSYFVRRQTLEGPSAQEVLDLFRDTEASNVELRKTRADARAVTVSKYYAAAPGADGAGLEVPRDALGSLWDRLEENPVTRALFHGLTRRLAHHVELFLSDAEFAVFWDTHGTLPVKKIQLRYIRRDGMPNSPFRKDGCVSADLFMLKKHRGAFEDYLKRTFGAVRMNPGKHSMG